MSFEVKRSRWKNSDRVRRTHPRWHAERNTRAYSNVVVADKFLVILWLNGLITNLDYVTAMCFSSSSSCSRYTSARCPLSRVTVPTPQPYLFLLLYHSLPEVPYRTSNPVPTIRLKSSYDVIEDLHRWRLNRMTCLDQFPQSPLCDLDEYHYLLPGRMEEWENWRKEMEWWRDRRTRGMKSSSRQGFLKEVYATNACFFIIKCLCVLYH